MAKSKYIEFNKDFIDRNVLFHGPPYKITQNVGKINELLDNVLFGTRGLRTRRILNKSWVLHKVQRPGNSNRNATLRFDHMEQIILMDIWDSTENNQPDEGYYP